MLDLDVKEIEKKLDVILPLDKDRDRNARIAQYISTYNPLLQGVIEDWLNTGKETDFEYEGFSIFKTMELLNINFYWALDMMNAHLNISKKSQEYKIQNLESLCGMHDLLELE